MRNALMATLWLVVACKSGPKPGEGGCKADVDCKGDRVCVKGECIAPAPIAGAPAGGSAPTAGGAAGSAAAPAGSAAGSDEPGDPGAGSGAAPSGAGGAACEPVVAHLLEVAKADSSATAMSADDLMRKCTTQGPTPEHLACLMAASTVSEAGECDKRQFAGAEVDTSVVREFDGRRLDPADHAGSRDGDYLVFRETGGRKCGFLAREAHFASAIFVMCGGEIISGPLTSKGEIDTVAAEFANQQRQEADLVRGIMQNWPSGRETRVYDQNGVYVGTHF